MNKALTRLGYVQHNELFFDTLRFSLPDHVSAQKLRTIALSKEVNLRYYDNGDVGFSIDETTDLKDVNLLLSIFSIAAEETVQEVTDIPEAAFSFMVQEPNEIMECANEISLRSKRLI